MSTRVKIAGIAKENGWTIHVPEHQWEAYEYTRRNGRHRETVRVVYDACDRVLSASWQPTADGIGARAAGYRYRKEWVIAYLTGNTQTGA